MRRRTLVVTIVLGIFVGSMGELSLAGANRAAASPPSADLRDPEDVGFLLRQIKQWGNAISEPKQLLSPNPSDAAVEQALVFYVIMIIVPILVSVVVLAGSSGEWTDKLKLLVAGLASLFGSLLTTLVWHLPFKWMGGDASFSGTFIAMVYGSAPYLPILSFCSLIPVAGLPREYRRFAVDQRAMQKLAPFLQQHPETKYSQLIGGCFITVGLVLWCLIVTFGNLKYVHTLMGWKLTGAVILSLILSIPANWILQSIIGVLRPPLDELQVPPASGAQQE